MYTIAFFNNKGGVGKSTAAINVAHAMSLPGKRVLVSDLDSQRNTHTFFRDNAEPGEATRYENIAAGTALVAKDDPAAKGYGLQIADLPPALNGNTKALLDMCDYVFIPIELGTFAISGIARVTEVVAATKAKLGGCFVSKYDAANPSDRELDKLLRQSLGERVMRTRIPISRVIKNSVSYRLTAREYAEGLIRTKKVCEAANAYAELAKEILGICGGGDGNG
jgi:chromosome partitioning protein